MREEDSACTECGQIASRALVSMMWGIYCPVLTTNRRRPVWHDAGWWRGLFRLGTVVFRDCPVCLGFGVLGPVVCSRCEGSGRLQEGDAGLMPRSA